jgi:hypothetical protein
MAAKTYQFAKFTRHEEGVYTAKAAEVNFLPANQIRIEGFLGKPGFTDFVFDLKTKDGWCYVPRRPKEVGHYTLCILNI